MQCQSEALNELATSLAAAQSELAPAGKNAVNVVGGGAKRKYADLASVYDAIRLVLPKHGLSVVQQVLPTEGKAHVRTTLLHKSGQWIAGECILPCDRQGGIQGLGSAYTYARRYSLSALVGVVSEDDDDGVGAMPPKKEQAQKQPTTQKTREISLQQALVEINRIKSAEDVRKYYSENKNYFNNEILDRVTSACAKRVEEINPQKITDNQRKLLMAEYNHLSREERLEKVGKFFGKEISSFNDLTASEAADLIEVIQTDKANQAAEVA